MLIKWLNIYDPIKECYQASHLRIDGNHIKEISPDLLEKDSEPWIDLSGYFAYPAFVDAHVHLVGTGQKLSEPSLEHVRDLDQLHQIISEYPSEFICLRGWPSDHPPFELHRSLLDKLDSCRPLLIIEKCGHVGYANSSAIKNFSLNSCTPLDASDLNSGLLKERMLDKARFYCPHTFEQLQQYVYKAIKYFKSWGIASVHSDDWNRATATHLLSILEMQKELRIYEHINLSPPFSMVQFLQEKNKLKLFRHTPYLNVSSLKFILDGSLGGRSAYLKEAYADSPNHHGILYYSTEELKEMLIHAESTQWPCMFHVIGDAALEAFLDAFSFCGSHGNPLRHRLIHVQMASNRQIDLLNELQLYASIQPIFFPSDELMAKKRLGDKRFIDLAYPFKLLADTAHTLSLSTDTPVESANPFANLAAAESFMPRKKAFFAYTVAGAMASFQEQQQGIIQAGAHADIFFLKEDLFSIPSYKLPKTIPDLLMFDGHWFDLKQNIF